MTSIRSKPESGPVLVIGDEVGTRELLRGELEREEFEVVEAENGRVGLQRVTETKPWLIPLDLIMPKMDGLRF